MQEQRFQCGDEELQNLIHQRNDAIGRIDRDLFRLKDRRRVLAIQVAALEAELAERRPQTPYRRTHAQELSDLRSPRP